MSKDVDFNQVMNLADGTRKRLGDCTKADMEQAAAYIFETAAIHNELADVHEESGKLLDETGERTLAAVIRKGGDAADRARAVIATEASLQRRRMSRIDVGPSFD